MITASDNIIADVSKGSVPQVIPIDVFADVDDIVVYEINETTGAGLPLTLATHFTLSTLDEWEEAGANLTIKSGGGLGGDGWVVASPTRYVVLNSAAREQTDSVDNSDNWDGPTIERNWDRLQMQIKYLDEMIRTCIRTAPYDGHADNQLGSLVDAKDTLLGFNATSGRPEYISKSGFVVGIQQGLQASKTVAIGGSEDFASVQLTAAEESVMVEIIATTELGASVRHIYMVTREAGASAVTATKIRDTVVNDIEATELVDIGTTIATTTVTFDIDGTAFAQETDVDVVLILTKLKAISNHTLVAI